MVDKVKGGNGFVTPVMFISTGMRRILLTITNPFNVVLTLLHLTMSSPELIIFFQITNWVELENKQYHSKVLLSSFPLNGHNLGFCTWSQKLESFVSPKV